MYIFPFFFKKCIFVQYLNDFLLVCNKAFSGKPMKMVSLFYFIFLLQGFPFSGVKLPFVFVDRSKFKLNTKILIPKFKDTLEMLLRYLWLGYVYIYIVATIQLFLFKVESQVSSDKVSGVSHELKRRKRRKEVNYSFINPSIVV